MSSSTTNNSDELFADLNRTELYQLCRKAKRSVHPAWDRMQLIAALEDSVPEEIAIEHPIDALRTGLIAFIECYWRTLHPQLKCPAKDLKDPNPQIRNPRPCFGCTDMQVMKCVSTLDPISQQKIRNFRGNQ